MKRLILRSLTVIMIVVSFFPIVTTVETARAATTADVTVLATPIVGGIGCPSGLALIDYGIQIGASWNAASNATSYELYVSIDDYPDNRNDYILAYSGNDTAVNLTGYDLQDYRHYFSLWAYNGITYSPCYDTEHIRSNGMELIAFIAIPTLLLLGFVFSKNAVLGWICAIFWAVMAGFAYAESTTPDTGTFDLYYGLMWGSVAAMIACVLYAFAIGRDKDKEDEDEAPDNTPYIDGSREDQIKRIRSKRVNKRLEQRINRR